MSMKSRPIPLKIPLPTADPEIDIPIFDEAFDMEQLKKFYQDKDSTSTYSPYSCLSPLKESASNNIEEQFSWSLGAPDLKLQKKVFSLGQLKCFNAENNDEFFHYDIPWKIPKRDDLFEEIPTKAVVNKPVPAPVDTTVKVYKRPPFIIIRNVRRKGITLSSTIQESNKMNQNVVVASNLQVAAQKPKELLKKKEKHAPESSEIKVMKKPIFIIERQPKKAKGGS